MTDNALIEDVYKYWQEVMDRPRARMDAARAQAIRGRLKDGYTAQDLKDAIHGCAGSRFHRGENDRQKKYQDISLICRDAYHVDQFLDLFESEQRKQAQLARYTRPEQAEEKVTPAPERVAELRAIIGGLATRKSA
jgi:hypothetical protein